VVCWSEGSSSCRSTSMSKQMGLVHFFVETVKFLTLTVQAS
jgi:hypothetical protein